MDALRIDNLYPVSMELSAWVKLARQEKGWTQEDMADALGVTKGNVSAWENSRHEPGWGQILKIAGLTGQPLPIPKEMQASLRREDAELLADFSLLSAEDKTLVVYQVKRLADLTSKKVNEAVAENDGTMKSVASAQSPKTREAAARVDKRRPRIASPQEAAQSGRKMGVESAKRGAQQEGNKS